MRRYLAADLADLVGLAVECALVPGGRFRRCAAQRVSFVVSAPGKPPYCRRRERRAGHVWGSWPSSSTRSSMWRGCKSSFSGSQANCVEVAASDHVLVRDTKNESGVVLRFTPAGWRRFADLVKRS